MRSRLSLKIVGAFLLMACISIGLFVGLSRYYSNKNFRQYLLKKELEKLEKIAEAAAGQYSRAEGWDKLRRAPYLWRQVMASGREEGEAAPQGMGPGLQDSFPGHPGPPIPGPAPQRMAGPLMGPAGGDPLRLAPRICLLDAQKNRVLGVRAPMERLTLVPVRSDKTIVGWLGILKDVEITHTLEMDFIHRQTKAIYWIGGVILLLSVIFSMILARSLVLPIRQLVSGTREIAGRRFEVRIPVKRSDELGRLADDFNHMAEQLEAYAKMQKQWISDISHELRTPLSVLIGSIEALQDGVRKPDTKTLAMLHAKAAHIRKLVADLHDLSMAESNAMKMERLPLDPWLLVLDVKERFRDRSDKKRLTVSVENAIESPQIVVGDPDRLTQVFFNLLENSLRHTDLPGELRIRQESEKGSVLIVFEDSAPGVSEEALSRIFNRLFRTDPSRSSDTGGSGLGLSICKGLVEAHGGTIRAESSKLGGLRIEIRLPASENNSRPTE